jgi:hypothetical protein
VPLSHSSVEGRSLISNATLFGASFLSAAGWLPLHLLPLLVVAVAGEHRASVSEAGLMGSAFMLGQLLAALSLPLLQVMTVRRMGIVAGVAILIVALGVSSEAGFRLLLFCWLLVGGCCGLLLYLGTTVTSQHADAAFAFTLRLAVSLLLAGLVVGGLGFIGSFASYSSIAVSLALLFLPIAILGLALYRPPQPGASTKTSVARFPSWRGATGLAMVYVLFAGQVGFWAYVVQGVGERGMRAMDAAMAVAACKILAAFILIPVAYYGKRHEIRSGLAVFGVILGAGILLIAGAKTPLTFAGGLLCWEVGFNGLSARLQSKAIQVSSAETGLWLAGALLLGAATGPALHGVAITANVQSAFLFFVLASTLMPAAWEFFVAPERNAVASRRNDI